MAKETRSMGATRRLKAKGRSRDFAGCFLATTVLSSTKGEESQMRLEEPVVTP
jgi:hypothetical protein